MSILEEFVEHFIGLIILVFAFVIIMTAFIDPTMEQIEINYNAKADKAVTFSHSFNQNDIVHDQKVGRVPGIDSDNETEFNHNDTGNSRRYFRAEQFIMLPSVDTDVSSNPDVDINTRVPSVASTYNVGEEVDLRGHKIGLDSFNLQLPYLITRESLYNKQVTYNSLSTAGVLDYLKDRALYPSLSYGTQVNGSTQAYGGFNITVESGIHNLSKKKGNTIIFVEGRVPTRWRI